MKFLKLLGVTALTLSVAAVSNASEVDSDAGAKIVAPLEITNTASLYFGTIAPSLDQDENIFVDSTGIRDCGSAVTCLTNDHSAAQFTVSGEDGMSYYINLPGDGEVELSNGSGGTMSVSSFVSSKADEIGTLTGGTEDFAVGANLSVTANQPTGDYVGTFAVSVEYN